MANPKTYDLTRVVLSIGGRTISGYGETGAVEYEMTSDVAERFVSADGQPVYSRLNDRGMTATITVHEMSKANRDLWELYQIQAAQETIEPMAYRMNDTISGDAVEDAYAVIIALPGPSKGRTVGEREWQVSLPNGRDGMTLAPLIAI